MNILFKRGNTSQNDLFTGLLGEVTIDTQLRQLRIHDGVLAGGHPVATQAEFDTLVSTVANLATVDIAGLDTALGSLQSQIDTKVESVLLGAANGVATLDGNGLVPSNQLPSYVDDVIEVANYAALPVTGETSKIYITLDTNETFRWSGTIYVEIAKGDVSSVNGRVGLVVLDKTDVGLGNVDNTSDVNKPISTASQNALDLKAPLASPNLTGTPTAPTPSTANNTTTIATTAFVHSRVNQVTKTDVGLGNVDNYSTATIPEATAGVSSTTFATPESIKTFVENGTYTIDLGVF